MEFKTQYNAVPSEPRTYKSLSQTVPDMHMSLREIERRFANGLPLTPSPHAQYTGETILDGLPDARGLDLSEAEQLWKQAEAEGTDAKQKLNDLRKRVDYEQKKQEETRKKKEATQDATIIDEEKSA